MEKGLSAGSARKDHEILQTNLQSFFWRKVRNIIRQNKKGALQEFLFGSTYGRGEVYTILDTSSNPALQELQNQIQSLHNKVDSLRFEFSKIEQMISMMISPCPSGRAVSPCKKRPGGLPHPE